MSYYDRRGKRLTDIAVAVAGLCLLWPVLVAIAVLVRIESPGPILFRQLRIGRHLTPFSILKFRTMTHAIYPPQTLTVAGDARVTRLGRLLRPFRLDELPQLWNVLRGEMSIVGPRPETEYYVMCGYTESERIAIFVVRPGLTDTVTIQSLNEEGLLARQSNPIEYYQRVLLPAKIKGHLEYVREISLKSDLQIVIATAVAVLRHGFCPASHMGWKRNGPDARG